MMKITDRHMAILRQQAQQLERAADLWLAHESKPTGYSTAGGVGTAQKERVHCSERAQALREIAQYVAERRAAEEQK